MTWSDPGERRPTGRVAAHPAWAGPGDDDDDADDEVPIGDPPDDDEGDDWDDEDEDEDDEEPLQVRCRTAAQYRHDPRGTAQCRPGDRPPGGVSVV